MATSVLLVAKPLTSLKQTSQIPFSRLRSLPTKPLQFTKATFRTQHLYSSSRKYDLKLKCSSDKNHFTSKHASQSEVNPTQHPLETVANEILPNVLKGLKTPAVENPPFDAIFNETFSSVLKGLQTTATGTQDTCHGCRVLDFVLSFHPNSAWAASGGRIGGSSFSSRSSSSSSSESSSNSSSSSRRSSSPSYSSSSSNSGRSSPSYSSSSSSPSYSSSSSSSSSRRSSSPLYSSSSSPNSSSSSNSSSPSYSSSSSNSRRSSSPSYSYSSSNSSSPSYSSSPSNSYTSYSSSSKPSSSSPTSSSSSNYIYMSEAEFLLWLHFLVLMFLLPTVLIILIFHFATPCVDQFIADYVKGVDAISNYVNRVAATSNVATRAAATSNIATRAAATSNVVKLQVGLLGTARALQRDLDRIAETANTSTPEGLSYVLTEAIVALLRYPDYWISSYSSITPNYNMEDAEKCFNKISIEERAKFDEETLVNVNNMKRKSSTSKTDDGFQNEYIVVTLLVAIEGKYKLSYINSSDDFKEALKNLGSIRSKDILAVEVLWTPQKENDTLSEEELIEDYPLLKRF